MSKGVVKHREDRFVVLPVAERVDGKPLWLWLWRVDVDVVFTPTMESRALSFVVGVEGDDSVAGLWRKAIRQ